MRARSPSITTCPNVRLMRRRRRRSGGSSKPGGSSPPSLTSGPGARGTASKPNYPMSAGKPTSLTSPAPTASCSRCSTSSTTTRGRASSPAPPPPPNPPTLSGPCTAGPNLGLSRSVPHRQRRHLHRLTPPQRHRRHGTRAAVDGDPVQALPPLPPPDLRESRTLPPNPQTQSRQTTAPGNQAPAASPARPLRRLLQPHAPTPSDRTAAAARRVHRPRTRLPTRTDHRLPATASATTASAPTAPSPSATTPGSTTSPSAPPTATGG